MQLGGQHIEGGRGLKADLSTWMEVLCWMQNGALVAGAKRKNKACTRGLCERAAWT